MPIQKQSDPKSQIPAKSERKPWKKKSPVEVFLEQASKLKAEISEMEKELAEKRRQLQKFEEARKLFENA